VSPTIPAWLLPAACMEGFRPSILAVRTDLKSYLDQHARSRAMAFSHADAREWLGASLRGARQAR